MNTIKSIIEKIKEANKIAVIFHVNADGDAVGSALAFLLAFSKLGKDIDVFAEENLLHNLEFLPQSEKIIIGSLTDQSYDIALTLDCGDIHRMGKRVSIYNNAKFTINIDHHKTNNINADLNYVDINVSSTGEIMFEIIKGSGIEIDKSIAQCLYTAILTDTGGFKHSNTTSQTHTVCAELIDSGVDCSEVFRKVYEDVPFSRLKILGKILDTMELYHNDKVCLMSITYKEVNALGASFDDLDNIANYGLSVQNVELSIFIKEISQNNIRVSFRSKYYFDCSKLASLFGGGGHARAAGCDIKGNVTHAKGVLLSKVQELGITD